MPDPRRQGAPGAVAAGTASWTERASASTPARDDGAAQRWEQVLDQLERRLVQWSAALEGEGPYPEELRWPADLGRCPDHLVDRARRVHAAQQDLRARLGDRRQALAALLRSDASAGRTRLTPLYVDQHS